MKKSEALVLLVERFSRLSVLTLFFSDFLLILMSRRLSVMSEDVFPVAGVLVLTPMLGVTLFLLPPGPGVPPANTMIMWPPVRHPAIPTWC